jgi:hypothetical protein
MAFTDTMNFEEVAELIQKELRKSQQLSYVKDDSIIIIQEKDKDTLPTFVDYLIRISAADNFLNKIPRIGKYFRYYYNIAIEIWIKSQSTVSNRLLSGNISQNKGIWEFFKDVNDTLEHNTLQNRLDSHAGPNVQNPVTLKSDNELIEGVGFLWTGCQDNNK